MKLAIFLLCFSAFAAAEKPLPTIEQCRASYKYWQSDTDVRALSAGTMTERSDLMMSCILVAAEQHGDNPSVASPDENLADIVESHNYAMQAALYARGARDKYAAFLKAHGLLDTFAKYDHGR